MINATRTGILAALSGSWWLAAPADRRTTWPGGLRRSLARCFSTRAAFRRRKAHRAGAFLGPLADRLVVLDDPARAGPVPGSAQPRRRPRLAFFWFGFPNPAPIVETLAGAALRAGMLGARGKPRSESYGCAADPRSNAKDDRESLAWRDAFVRPSRTRHSSLAFAYRHNCALLANARA